MNKDGILSCLLFFTLAVSVSACAEAPLDKSVPTEVDAGEELAAFKAAIREKYDLKEKAFAEDDIEPIINEFYAPDARSVDGTSGHTYAGTAAYREEYAKVVPPYTVKIESVSTFVKGSAGWDWANFYVTPDDANEKPFSFMILFLWARENGEWKSKGDFYGLGKFPNQTAPAE